ncbi:class I SAM-dependent methyltransferase [candidate division KSB1 bacterium]|nr:class I SAM-dependent methyltransferase [candidate division KSB1 bacterium]
MKLKSDKIYPESGVELNSFSAGNYDKVMNIASLGLYCGFIRKAIKAMNIQDGDKILDLGCGTGRNACVMAKYLNGDGKITGMDVSSIMEKQFRKKCTQHQNVEFIRQRIDQPFDISEKFDKIFISFVIHGFPHQVRQTVLENVSKHLKPGGAFFMLDFAEFNMNAMPSLFHFIFKNIECKYAFDFIERDWKRILTGYHFSGFEEFFFFKNYVRLLKAKKLNVNKENSVRIAVPTNDGINIFPKMLGMAKDMFIYEIENGAQFKLIEKRTNPYQSTMQHLKTLDVYETIRDCSIIISAHIGKKGIKRLEEKGMKLFFRKGNIQEVLTGVIKKLKNDRSQKEK